MNIKDLRKLSLEFRRLSSNFLNSTNDTADANLSRFVSLITTNELKLLHLPWGKKAVRIAISIGQDADDDVLQQFTGNRELVLQANNPQALVKMIKWASTAASLVSAPASRPKEMDVVPAGNNTPSATNAPLVLDMNNIPDPGSIGANDVW